MFSSTQFLLLFAAAFSLFIVACMKEQTSSNSSSSKRDLSFIVGELSKKFDIKPVNLEAKSRSEECQAEPISGQDCLTFDIQLNDVIVPAFDNFPDCDDVTVTARVTLCFSEDGSVSVAYDNFDYETCQEVMEYLNSLTGTTYMQAEEKYTYKVSLIAEYMFSSQIALIYGVNCSTNKFVESHFYSDICYKRCVEPFKYIINNTEPPVVVEVLKFKTYKCGEGCCLRQRNFCVVGGNITSTTPTYTQIGGDCEDLTTTCSKGQLPCRRTCGPQ